MRGVGDGGGDLVQGTTRGERGAEGKREKEGTERRSRRRRAARWQTRVVGPGCKETRRVLRGQWQLGGPRECSVLL